MHFILFVLYYVFFLHSVECVNYIDLKTFMQTSTVFSHCEVVVPSPEQHEYIIHKPLAHIDAISFHNEWFVRGQCHIVFIPEFMETFKVYATITNSNVKTLNNTLSDNTNIVVFPITPHSLVELSKYIVKSKDAAYKPFLFTNPVSKTKINNHNTGTVIIPRIGHTNGQWFQVMTYAKLSKNIEFRYVKFDNYIKFTGLFSTMYTHNDALCSYVIKNRTFGESWYYFVVDAKEKTSVDVYFDVKQNMGVSYVSLMMFYTEKPESSFIKISHSQPMYHKIFQFPSANAFKDKLLTKVDNLCYGYYYAVFSTNPVSSCFNYTEANKGLVYSVKLRYSA